MKNKSFYKILLFISMISFIATPSHSQTKKAFTLVIDAGHGGHDSGTTGNNKYKRYEKDVALTIATKFGKLVGKYMNDVKVVYTRKSDVFIKLKDRPKIANDNNADLFVSIHCNANDNSSINGSETYVLGTHQNDNNFNVAKKENSVIYLEDDYTVSYEGFDPNSMASLVGLTLGQEQYIENSLLLASLIQKKFKEKTELRSRGSNGVKQAGFWVLARNSMPSVLVETGFLSNDKDAKYLMSERGSYEVANALFLGFKEYKKFWDDQIGLSYNIPTEENEEVTEELVEELAEDAPETLSRIEQAKAEVAKAEAAKAEKSKVDNTKVEQPSENDIKNVKSNEKSSSQPVEAKSTVGMIVGAQPSESKTVDSKSSSTTIKQKENPTPKVEIKKDTPKNDVRIEYAIQLMSSKTKLSTKNKTFKGLPKVSYYKDGATYKYIYNRNSNYDDVLSSQKLVKNKGFKGSFVVAFKNGKRISLSRALKEDKRR